MLAQLGSELFQFLHGFSDAAAGSIVSSVEFVDISFGLSYFLFDGLKNLAHNKFEKSELMWGVNVRFYTKSQFFKKNCCGSIQKTKIKHCKLFVNGNICAVFDVFC